MAAPAGSVKSSRCEGLAADVEFHEMFERSVNMSEREWQQQRKDDRAIASMRPSARMLASMVAEAEAAGVLGKVSRCGHCGVAMGGKQSTAKYCGQTCRKAANRDAKRVTP